MEPEFLVIVLMVRLVTAVICAAIASSKGRSVAGWFFGGLALEIIAVIIVACLPNLKAERNYRMQVEMANHRLREQLRQERMKSEAFRQYSSTRLDAHDQVLGIDTRSMGPMLGGGSPMQQLGSDRAAGALNRLAADAGGDPAAGQIPPVQYAEGGADASAQQGGGNGSDHSPRWFYAHAGMSYGPVPKASIEKMLREQTLTNQSLLWTEGMVDWAPVWELPAFRNSGAL